MGFAVVLMSDKDDMGAEVGSLDYKPRARQNVILELGYFIGRLGRKNHVCVLKKGDVEVPSDILGVLLFSNFIKARLFSFDRVIIPSIL